MPFPEERCEACPLTAAGRDGDCLAQARRHARFCEHAAAGHEGYIGVLLGDQAPAVVQQALPVAVPRDRWPLGIALVAWLAGPEDRGLGDTVARTIGPIGGDAFKAWHLRVTGQECGCGARQDALNASYPYAKPEGP